MNKNSRLVFNAVGLEIFVIADIFSDIDILGYEIDSKEIQNQLVLVDSRINIFSSEEISRINNKIKFLYNAIKYLGIALKKTKAADVIYVRGPGFPMLVGLVLCLFFPKKIWWFKFANLWKDKSNSNFWNLQKLMLRRFSWIKVTVNGKIEIDPSHIINFENPCLFESEKKAIFRINSRKALRIVFAGRLTEAKGIYLAISSIKKFCLQHEEIKVEFIIVGPGELSGEYFKLESNSTNLTFTKLGSISKEKLLEVFENSDFLLLPTLSPEGFPKVVAEAMSMGCIPVVTDISAIPDYLTHGVNGFLLNSNGDLMDEIINCFCQIHLLSESQLFDIRQNAQFTAYNHFTYERFVERVRMDILEIE